MLGIHARISQFVFVSFSRGLTRCIAAAAASCPLWETGKFCLNGILPGSSIGRDAAHVRGLFAAPASEHCQLRSLAKSHKGLHHMK